MSVTKQNIKKMQTFLTAAGLYTDDIDGIAGENTVLAVQAAANVICPNNTPTVNAPVAPSQPSVVEPPKLAHYILSEQSLQRLKGVHPDLVKVVKRAIQITEMDFAVNEGLRSIERQRQLVNKGASQTMKSNHITGHAVDLVPTPNGGAMNWNDWSNYYVMVEGMQKAAEELNVKVRWGGCWETINGKTGSPKSWVDAYGARKRAQGKKVFTDGPHFELA